MVSLRGRPIDVKLLLASFAIATGLVLVGIAVLSAESGADDDFPSVIESVAPVPDAVQVLAQSQVIVDLAEGYEGRLVIDGQEFDTIRLDEIVSADVEPGAQIDVPPGVVFEPGNATLTFTPGEGAPIERFDPGTHTVSVIYWRTDEGPRAARSYRWSFEVI